MSLSRGWVTQAWRVFLGFLANAHCFMGFFISNCKIPKASLCWGCTLPWAPSELLVECGCLIWWQFGEMVPLLARPLLQSLCNTINERNNYSKCTGRLGICQSKGFFPNYRKGPRVGKEGAALFSKKFCFPWCHFTIHTHLHMTLAKILWRKWKHCYIIPISQMK